MADVSFSFSSVYPSASASLVYGYVAAQSTKGGELVFLNASQKWESANSSDLAHGAATTAMLGMAVNQAVTNMHLTVCVEDKELTVGSGALTKGGFYALSTNAKMLCPIGDLSSTTYRAFVGTAISSAAINLKITQTGATT